MKQHIEATPPALSGLRHGVPRVMSNAVAACLSKDPSARPQSAAAFGSAMKVSIERTGALLRHSFSLYSEHFPLFFKLSFVAHVPVLLVAALEVIVQVSHGHSRPGPGAAAITGLVALVQGIVSFLASVMVVGVTIRLVSQVFVAPLRPVLLRPALHAFRKRLWPLTYTALMVAIGTLFGLALLVIPGLVFYLNSTLSSPVVMMENLKGRKALKRSKSLVKRSRPTVIAIVIIQYAIPIMVEFVVFGATSGFVNGHLGHPELLGNVTTLTTRLVSVLVVPLIATMTALLYLNTRQAGGETLAEMLSEFESEDLPRTRWQMKMREKTSLPSPVSRVKS